MPPWAAIVWLRVGNTFVMQAVVRPASTAPWVARKPAPPAPTTTTSNVWSTKSYVRAELMLSPDEPGLHTDLQHGVTPTIARTAGLGLNRASSDSPFSNPTTENACLRASPTASRRLRGGRFARSRKPVLDACRHPLE